MSNMLGILAQGLRIAPPEAPSTGYMFGKGLYFADLFSKSALYSGRGSQSSLMLLCEVALGNMMDLYKNNYIESLPNTFNSVRANGKKGANYEHKTVVTPEGFEVPMGKSIENEEPTPAKFDASLKYDLTDPNAKNFNYNSYYNSWQKRFNWPLQSNEYVVYNVDQVKARYLI